MAFPHYMKAVESMRGAAAKADDTPLFYEFWWTGSEKSPMRREHLRREGIYLESMALVGREIGLQFSLNALYERVGHDAAIYRQQAKELLLEDRDACRDATEFLERIKAQGDDKRKDRDWAPLYRAKAEGIEGYLRNEAGK